MQSELSQWQDEAQRCGVVLREVFAWLPANDLVRVSSTCTAWYRAAAEPPLWRRLLFQDLAPNRPIPTYHPVSWKQEYATARAGWALEALVPAGGGAALLHADLAPTQATLALGADDASVALWRRHAGAWQPSWRCDLRPRGWAAVARVQWARAAPRLLLAGPLALVRDWELLVLRVDEDCGGGVVVSRVRCSAGAAGCWADAAGEAFLSLELRLLGPGLACTTVRLNAATQETQSEYAGVTTPLLTIFNEDRAHITHVVVAERRDVDGDRRVLVAGTARGLGAWPVALPLPPPLLAGAPGELAERVRRHRARAAAPLVDPPAPDEAVVRAACAAPDRHCRLDAPLVGLTLHDSGRWLWALCSDGSAACVCAKSLEPQCVLRAPTAGPRDPAHYVQPAVSDRYVASPEGSYSPRVWTWSLRSGAGAQAGDGAGGERGAGDGARHAGPAVCALLPRDDPDAMLVLAADSLYVWRLRMPPPLMEAL